MSNFDAWEEAAKRDIEREVALVERQGISQQRVIHKLRIAKHSVALRKLEGRMTDKQGLDIKAWNNIGKVA